MTKNNTFIYLPEIIRGNKIINDYIDDGFKESIDQNIIPNFNKFLFF